MGICNCIHTTEPIKQGNVLVESLIANTELQAPVSKDPIQQANEKKTPRGSNPSKTMSKPLSPILENRIKEEKEKERITFSLSEQAHSLENIVTLKPKNHKSHVMTGNQAPSALDSTNPNLNHLEIKNIAEKTKQAILRNTINIILLAPKFVDKSTFVNQFVDSKFIESQKGITTNEPLTLTKTFEFNRKFFQVNFIVVENEISSNACKEYDKADFFMVFYNLNDKKSFEQSKQIITKDVKNFLYVDNNKNSNVILVGNQNEAKQKEVTISEVDEYCQKQSLDHFEISVRGNMGITGLMNKIIQTYDQQGDKARILAKKI